MRMLPNRIGLTFRKGGDNSDSLNDRIFGGIIGSEFKAKRDADMAEKK